MLPSAELRNDKKGNIDLVVEEKDKGAPEYLEKAPCVFFFPHFCPDAGRVEGHGRCTQGLVSIAAS